MLKLHWVCYSNCGFGCMFMIAEPTDSTVRLLHMYACLDKLHQPRSLSASAHRCSDVRVQGKICLVSKKCNQKPVWELCD